MKTIMYAPRGLLRTARPCGGRLSLLALFQVVLLLLVHGATAAFISFENCMDTAIVNSNPKQLQFTPLYLNAHFDAADPAHNLNITIYGNVSGQARTGIYPPATDPSWTDPDSDCKLRILVGCVTPCRLRPLYTDQVLSCSREDCQRLSIE